MVRIVNDLGRVIVETVDGELVDVLEGPEAQELLDELISQEAKSQLLRELDQLLEA